MWWSSSSRSESIQRGLVSPITYFQSASSETSDALLPSLKRASAIAVNSASTSLSSIASHACGFTKEFDEAVNWRATFAAALARAETSNERDRYGSAPLRIRVG